MFEEVMEEIRKSDTVIIHRHSHPDGDALGSQIGLKHILQDNFPEKKIYVTGDDAGRYSFMDDCEMDEVPDSIFPGALCIILDCGASELVSDNRWENAGRTLRIDHHIFTGKFADTEISDAGFESCCGEITQLAIEQKLKVSPAAAKALFTGMVTDSGRFRYDSTSARTFRQAAYLMDCGAELNDIYLPLYADDFESKKLRAQYIMKIKFTPKNVAYIYTGKDELDKLGADVFSISRGMVNTMADIRGVEIWANFTETADGIQCELRSSRQSINQIAEKHGGGGHAKACGARLSSKAEAMEVLSELDDMIQE